MQWFDSTAWSEIINSNKDYMEKYDYKKAVREDIIRYIINKNIDIDKLTDDDFNSNVYYDIKHLYYVADNESALYERDTKKANDCICGNLKYLHLYMKCFCDGESECARMIETPQHADACIRRCVFIEIFDDVIEEILSNPNKFAKRR